MQTAPEPKPARVYLGLGSSLGDRVRHLRKALERLQSCGPDVRVTDLSPLYESPHLGLHSGDEKRYPAHLNLAARLETTLTPEVLLDCIHTVERAGKRDRRERWGPRTIDIDLLVYEGEERSTETLTLPHPEIARRAFVLKPLADLAPELRLADGRTVQEALNSDLIRSQQIALYRPPLTVDGNKE